LVLSVFFVALIYFAKFQLFDIVKIGYVLPITKNAGFADLNCKKPLK